MAEGTHALDQPQDLTPATCHQVRDRLEDLIGRDLLGPWDGPTEEFGPRAAGPRERYLVGMLGPKPTAVAERALPTPLADLDESVAGDGSEAELPEVSTAQTLGRMWASSMGLSCVVSPEVTTLAATVEWGHYTRREIPSDDTASGTARIWAREPVSHQVEIRLDGPASRRLPLTADDPTQPGVLLAVETRTLPDRRVVEVALINAQEEPERVKDTAWLFQCQLTLRAADGHEAVFWPMDDLTPEPESPQETGEDAEERHLRLLYRHQRRYAMGRNVAVHAEVRPDQRRAHQLATRWLPAFDVPSTLARVGAGSGLDGLELSMDALATAEPQALRAGLAPLVDGYTAWLDAREREIGELPQLLREVATAAVATGREAARRIGAGIDLLTLPESVRREEALAAFRFANHAMAAQRRHTEVGRVREKLGRSYEVALAEVEGRGAAGASWRPFQLAFVLVNLPALTEPDHPERAADATGLVDLLFFPTGGGKTEAYLGLTAYTFAIRRLQGTIGAGADARSGAGGVAVLMRYTLRLLTAQQFQRAAALVCAAEVLRAADPDRWGREPFRIGLWAGAGVSPNWFEDARRQIGEARDVGGGRRVNVLQTLVCPWCGTPLRAQHDLVTSDQERRVRLFCPNAEGAGACPFSRTRSAEGLPILTVDEEIYRYAPSLVIATVDKLAQLPWRGYAGVLFGRVSQWCPRHGYRHDDLDTRTKCHGSHHTNGGLPAVTSQPVIRLRPPDLIIQDEMHLISGALGTTVGLFEAAVDHLCTWPLPGGGWTGPKIVASTATTKRAREQVLGVFGRNLAVFPPPVLDIADTFFSHQMPICPEYPGRRYLGVCAHGVRMKAAEIRLAEILLLAGQTLFDAHGRPADPYLTLVGYFNATRELAGMRRYLDDDIATRLRGRGRREGLSDRIVTTSGMLTIQELTSRISSGDISDALGRLEYEFDEELDTSPRRRAIAAELAQSWRDKTTAHPLAERRAARARADRTPVDVVLATSMLQVGVDVSRFGLMVVTGQPKNTAEYIQATSRVGRDALRPGLVITLYNWNRPRDLAHFEDFDHYHATFYRRVEALSVTPYTRRALDRGAMATLVAAVRNIEENHSRDADAHRVPLDGPDVERILARWLARAEAIAGTRGREHLAERLSAIKNLWKTSTTGSTQLGYTTRTTKDTRLVGLLEPATGGRWTERTVGMSMRETENEINLLVPGGGAILEPAHGMPDWSFTPPKPNGTQPDESDDEEAE